MCTICRLVASSFALGAIALGSIALSVATNNWLITNEKRPLRTFLEDQYQNYEEGGEPPVYDANDTGQKDYGEDTNGGALYGGEDTSQMPDVSYDTGAFLNLDQMINISTYFGLWRFLYNI